MITSGRVEVDRHVVSELGVKVDLRTQEIRVDGVALKPRKEVYFLVNKPPGVVSTNRDPAGRPRIVDLMPKNSERLFTVGRLDMASEGLILLTNDGELAYRLTHPRFGVEKCYLVQVAGLVGPDVLAKLRRGVHLAEGPVKAVQAKIKSRWKQSTMLEIVLAEGRNREIRRLLAKLGHKVLKLTRVGLGPLRLGTLPPGESRRLRPDEVSALRRAAFAPPKHRRPRAASAEAPAEETSRQASRPASAPRRGGKKVRVIKGGRSTAKSTTYAKPKSGVKSGTHTNSKTAVKSKATAKSRTAKKPGGKPAHAGRGRKQRSSGR